MDVGKLESMNKKIIRYKKKEVESVRKKRRIGGYLPDYVFSYTGKMSGSIGLLCPFCYDFTIRRMSIQTKLKCENTKCIDETNVPEVWAFQQVEYRMRECPSCHNYDVEMIQIDPNIVESISILNKKGYKTKFCCEGHGDERTTAYILFENSDVLKYKSLLPITWEFDIEGNIEYNMCRIYSESANYKESIIDLREWVNLLPTNDKI